MPVLGYADDKGAIMLLVICYQVNTYIAKTKDEEYSSIDAVFGLESIDRHDDIAIASAMRTVGEESPSLKCYDATPSEISNDAVKSIG